MSGKWLRVRVSVREVARVRVREVARVRVSQGSG